jgi:hypothetical protein
LSASNVEWLFEIVSLMKGHVGGGPGFNGFKALIIGQI